MLRLTRRLSLLALAILLIACASPPVAPAGTPVPPIPVPSTPLPVPPTLVPPTATGDIKLTIVYDNTTTDPQLTPEWGFAAVVETGGHTLLFDTGTNGPVLLDNMRQLGIDPHDIEAVILSHEHIDHTGGLQALLDLGVRPTVYASSTFLKAFKEKVRAQTKLIEVDDALELLPGVHTTRTIGSTPEQALVLETRDGAVVITGCAHPGVVNMVREAQAVAGPKIALLAGGFHLGDMSESKLPLIVAEVRQAGVSRVMPSHCTGKKAIDMFRNEYGENFVEGGVGRTVAFSAQ